MKANQASHSIAVLCSVLGLSRSGYYAWLGREPSARKRQNEALLDVIREEHLASKGIYGSPRIHARLRRRGVSASRGRVARLMRQAGLCGVTRRKRFRTTRRDPGARPAPDLVDRAFEASAPNQLWVADITHVPTQGEALYLAVILDVWSRKVVGWATDTSMPAELVIAALDMALERRQPAAGVIHHSDQGSQYTSTAFRERCARAGVQLSMGSVGDCYDNAMAEGFFATLETELFDLRPLFEGPEQARREVFSYIEGFYNTQRLHGQLGYRSPVDFEATGSPCDQSRPPPPPCDAAPARQVHPTTAPA